MAWFDGERSLKEQMLGLEHALAEAKGRTVLDAGCAEGLIGIAFAKAGATVIAFDNNPDMIRSAERRGCGVRGFRAQHGDLNVGLPGMDYDIVLALAVLHKAENVESATRRLANAARRLMVVRLQHGSVGEVWAKHGGTRCDLREMLPGMGFRLEIEEPGPREELVQYWRRA
jgi:SAM-dependent methyltransferase